MSNIIKKKFNRGKNRKKSWKKINVKEVENYLEDKRLNERLGFDKNHQYFTIEKKGTPFTELEIPINKIKFKKKLKTTSEIVSNAAVFKALESTSKVDPCKTNRRGPVSIPQKLKKRKFPAKYDQSCLDYKKSIDKVESQADLLNSRYKSYDLWNNEKSNLNEDLDLDMKEIEHDQKVLLTAHQTKMPSYHLKKRSFISAVEVPHPGASYNPSLNDHQDLLKQAHLIEVKKKKEEEHYKRVIKKYFLRGSKRDLEKEWLEDMSAGLTLTGKKDKTDDYDTDDENDGIEKDLICPKNKIVTTDNRKLKYVRRKEMLKKLNEEKRNKAKKQKSIENQINQIKKIKKEILKKEKESQERIEKRKLKKKQKMYKPARLGPHKYEAPDIEINLTNQLTGNLRNLKTQSLLFEDRLKSLQRRNIIEPRKKILKKTHKKNVKLYEKLKSM